MQTNRITHLNDNIRKQGIEGCLEIWVTPHEKRLLSVPSEMVDEDSHKVEATPEELQKLPEDWVYDNIKDAIYHCRRIYYIYMGILCYTLLTILTTPTLDLFIEQIIKMPFMNAEMPLNYYLVISPMLLIGFFVYKQLYLLKTNKLIKYAVDKCKSINKGNCSECRDQTKDCTLNMMCKHHLSRLYPWIIIYCQLVENRPDLEAQKDRLSSWVGKLQQAFVSFSLWGLLPSMLLLLSIFVIRKHSLPLSIYMFAVTCLGMAVVTFFWYHHQKILYRTKSIPSFVHLLVLAATVCSMLIPVFLNIIAFHGKLPWVENQKLPWGENHWKEEKESTILSLAIRNVVFADLSQQIIAEEPQNESEYWIDLRDSHFEGANLSKAEFKKAYLKGSYLDHAYLGKAKLEEANLDGVHANRADFSEAVMNGVSCIYSKFVGSNFSDAKLNHAKYSNAKLVGADFNGAELSDALIVGSEVEEAYFCGATLSGASLINSNLKNADFRNANLEKITYDQYDQFSTVKTLYQAKMDPALKSILKSRYPHLFDEPPQKCRIDSKAE